MRLCVVLNNRGLVFYICRALLTVDSGGDFVVLGNGLLVFRGLPSHHFHDWSANQRGKEHENESSERRGDERADTFSGSVLAQFKNGQYQATMH